jgi:ABC-2 type transport system ATP-binding protein
MLRITGLRKAYGSLVALDGLDLEVADSEITALLGPNGAGKSTAVKCVVGLLDPDAGSVQLDDIDVLRNRAAAKRRIGYLPEVARLYEALTPVEYLTLKGRLFDLDENAIRTGIGRLLEGFGLQDRAREPMAAFSKGMMQKVALASALLTEPRLLILDEPLTGLDVNTAMVVKEIMREFAARGGAVLHCSHILDVVENTADRVALLDRGRLLASGTVAELRTKAGAGADKNLESVFRTLTHASDPVAQARAILGG